MHFIKFFLVLYLVLMQSGAWAYAPLPEAQSEEEVLFIRRILDFWKDKEYPLAKTQIQDYLKKFPHSPCTDHFWAMLGDMAMKTKDFKQALEFYEKVEKLDLISDVQTKKWQALYQLEHYSQLYQEISIAAPKLTCDEEYFYYAEAAFKEALTLLHYPEAKQEAYSLCEEALPFYKALIENEFFSPHAKLALALIYSLLEKHEKAAAYYLESAEHFDHSDLVYKAALSLTHCDKKRAEPILKTLSRSEDQNASAAAFSWLQLLAENEDWKTISHERDLFVARLSQEQLPLCYFYLGMYHFDQKMFNQSVADLKKCVDQNLPPKFETKALSTLMMTATELNDLELCESCFQRLTTQFEQARPEALFLLAKAYQRNSDSERALALYTQFTHLFSNTELAQSAQIEKIRLLSEKQRFEEAHEAILAFLEIYPLSSKASDMIRFAIEMSIHQLAEQQVYEQLAADIERGIKAHIFHPLELLKKQDLLAKTYLKLGKSEPALSLLKKMEDPDPLLLVHCYLKNGSSFKRIIKHGERALAKYPEEKKLRLHLFNAYLERARENEDPSDHQLAAKHLSCVIDTFPISLENRLWLAQHFVEQDTEKAIPILESLTLTPTNLKRFDHEALQLADLYQKKGMQEKAQTLLEQIIALDQTSQTRAKLLLAQSLLQKVELNRAKTLFSELETASQPEIAYAASLQLARLEFLQAPEKNLHKLQDLAKRKALIREPIHLEAALDYAAFKSSLYSEQEQPAIYLQLLLDLKDAFTAQDDILSKDYHASRELLPDKNLIYEAYMRYVDACIYTLEAQIADSFGDQEEKRTKQSAAEALFATLRQKKYVVSTYLSDKIKAS